MTRILLAVDESEHSCRAASYVGALLRGTRHASITLYHVLKPLPRKLLEHGGSEDPVTEAELSDQLRHDQGAWLEQERDVEGGALSKARAALEKAGFDRNRVTLKFGYEEDVARGILEEARSGQYSTIIVGRHGVSDARRLFGGGVTEQLLRDSTGFAIWVVE